tara:strand:+ start:261 stop:3062 length:2802 start_codon:yes stop_codon:yes gene_type:complete
MEKTDYKGTLNLPQTDFPMKANLKKREPEQISVWEEKELYKKIRRKSEGREKFVFHDGPPYANGHIHMGHALNKVLKDFIVRIMTMRGYDATFIPGWDCHGLPIEHQVMKELGKKKSDLDKAGIRKLCREYAARFIEIQREEFKRIGISADWDRPYLTMDFSYEAAIVREFGKFVQSGYVYRGLKPVHWCTQCQTALAEAEVEYANHASPSIYVKFLVTSDLSTLFPEATDAPVNLIIWTTTPWTLPANMGVCLHPDFQYSAVKIENEILIVAEELLSRLILEWNVKDYKVLGTRKGAELEKQVCKHPFIDRDSLVVLGEHVTLEQGTGCVHTAPGHGQEDYVVGNKYGLEIYNPVDDGGVFKPEVESFGGQFIHKANPNIVEKLRELGSLVCDGKIEHSYPHCWRCRQPIIFRATGQWFINMECNELRQKALNAIRQTKWLPLWGEERIYSMIENRPDWCVSRQRAWGTPVAVVCCSECETPVRSMKLYDYVAGMIEVKGADWWFDSDLSELTPSGLKCEKCGAMSFTKEDDILDVWFDSGVSHAVVLENNSALNWPADLYLEGSDQHRGWFHSSLLQAIGSRGSAPYKRVLTHGYVVDGKGKKMSKSEGNVIAPDKIIDQYGAEILRLWVASENYREDIRISNEILKRLTEAYRKIRNTFRYLLGNLNGFNPVKDKLPFDQLFEIDQYILFRFHKLTDKILNAFENYEFHVFYHSFYNFCVVDLSSFYLDILKDRLYTYPKNSIHRRSGQTVMHDLLMGMTRLMAPILSFTADEIWSYLPNGSADEDSVHLSNFTERSSVEFDDNLSAKWDSIVHLKNEVSKALELRRRDKVIGHSLDALVELVLPESLKQLSEEEREDLRYILIVSAVEILESMEGDDVVSGENMPGLKIRVSTAPGIKCERCWNYFTESKPDSNTICSRCVANLALAKV